MLCKGDQLLGIFLGIPKVLEVWSTSSHHSLPSTSRDHAGDKPSTSNSKGHGKKRIFKLPCKLCEGNDPIHLFPLLFDTSKELENLTSSYPHLPDGYQKISLDPLLVDQVIYRKSYLVKPTLSESESLESIIHQPSVERMVDLAPPSVNYTFSVESEPISGSSHFLSFECTGGKSSHSQGA